MAKRGSRKKTIMAVAVLCLFIGVVIALSGAGKIGKITSDLSDSLRNWAQNTPSGSTQLPSSDPAKKADELGTQADKAQAENTRTAGAQPDDTLPDDAQPGDTTQAGPDKSSYRSTSALRCIHYTEKDFFDSVSSAANTGLEASSPDSSAANVESDSSSVSGKVVGGVVPHHLLAANMIAEFFSALAQRPPDTLVIVGPNHRRIGLNGLHTSTLDWVTPFGVLETDSALTASLMEELKASQNDALMELEHSISSLVPYIKYYLPETKIVPILLHGNYSLDDSRKLGEFISQAMKDDEGISLIASIDFSHYLDTDAADRMDAITLNAIESRDTLSLIKMNNDNLDSPPSILTLLSAMDNICAAGPHVIGHDNSYGITGSSADYTTSYYTMLFRR